MSRRVRHAEEPPATRGGKRTERTPAKLAEALDVIVTLGPGRLDERTVDGADELRRKLDERLARGDGLTVAALAGGTGVGKSALFNAVVGRPVAREGVKRPTTSVASAAVSEESPQVSSLLDWLDVPERHQVGSDLPRGLVLLDLPDHDSVADEHRRTASRLAQRVDVVVWVLDPIKYARADAHLGPLASLTAHADVLLVVLNRSDELADEDLAACHADLEARLASGGHDGSTLLVTSAATGEGVAQLRARLADLAERRTAAVRRLTADAAVLSGLAADRLDGVPDVAIGADDVLGEVMLAVDGHRAAAETAGLYRREAARRTRSPLGRAFGKPFRLAAKGMLQRGQQLEATPPREATVDGVHAVLLRALDVGGTSGYTHAALDRIVDRATHHAAPALTDAVSRAGHVPAPRWWWPVMAALRFVAELGAITGALWLTALAAMEWLRLPALPVPEVAGDLSWPTALLLTGVLARIVLGLSNRLVIGIGARRHATRIRRRITDRLRAVVDRELLGPVRDELAEQRRLREAIVALRSDTPTS